MQEQLVGEIELRERIQFDMKKFGWTILSTNYQGLDFSHTFGLSQNFQHAEIEVVGLPNEMANLFLNTLAERIKNGANYENGDKITDFVDNFVLVLTHNPSDLSGPNITGDRLRLVWPDSSRLYPWSEGCDELCSMQRLLPDSTSPLQEFYEQELLFGHLAQ